METARTTTDWLLANNVDGNDVTFLEFEREVHEGGQRVGIWEDQRIVCDNMSCDPEFLFWRSYWGFDENWDWSLQRARLRSHWYRTTDRVLGGIRIRKPVCK